MNGGAMAPWNRVGIARLAKLIGLAALALGVQSNSRGAQPSVMQATAIFAGGCFWCMEADFEKLPGVLSVESGYIGGTRPNPSYREVSAGTTGHAEAVHILYDPAKLSYEQLLEHFWRNIDPTVKDRQFCDIGSQYRSGIYWQTEAERAAAQVSREALLKSGKIGEIHTEIARAGIFYPAEEYHQDYYKKNPVRYAYYRHGCGRDARLKELWAK